MLSYIHWDIDPEIFELFGISVRYYGVIFVGGLVLSLYMLKYLFQDQKIPVEYLDTLAMYGMLGILVGARMVHCLFYETDYYLAHPLEILLPFRHLPQGGYEFVGYQGLASHGGVLGMALALLAYTYQTKQPIVRTMGLVAIAAPIAAIFIRLANLMNSEIVGIPTQVAWAFVFVQVDDLPRHPAQLYEAIGYFCVFLVVVGIYTQRKLTLSPIFYLGLSLAGVFGVRFLVEFWKENQVEFEQTWVLNMGQWLSLPFFLLGCILVISALLNKKDYA